MSIRLKLSEIFVLAAMVAIAAAVFLRDALLSIPAASAGPVPAISGVDCHDVEAVGSLAKGFAIDGPEHLPIRVRVPTNYDARRAYPLLVVYPPAGYDRFAAERFYEITEAATREGWIIAYSDARPLSLHAVKLQAGVAEAVARGFCIAYDQIAALGHSDGGALAQGTVALMPSHVKPRAIFASAAGITRSDLEIRGCIAGINVMIVHNRRDDRFPDFGRDAAAYWASCGRCSTLDAAELSSDTCQRASGCAEGAEVIYCEVSTPHEEFPPLKTQALEFLSTATLSIEKKRH
jgi:polyhydroxybutyrate depolymerase